ncbi:MAG: pyridoxamine 5'-phosphate oxidase family protein, partial [Bacteroidetes bacterium]
MDIKSNWDKIRMHFNKSFSSNFHVSIASIGTDDTPTVTPIGSLFLNFDQTGYYFEKYPTKLPTYARINKKICVLAVNSHT